MMHTGIKNKLIPSSQYVKKENRAIEVAIFKARFLITSTSISTRAQHAGTTYQQGVCQTGGEVRPAKCKWYSITFKWKSGKWFW